MFAGFHNQSPWLTMMCVRNEDFFKAITSIFLFILMLLSLVITSFLCLILCLLSTLFTRWPFVWSRTANHNSRSIYKQNRLVNIVCGEVRMLKNLENILKKNKTKKYQIRLSYDMTNHADLGLVVIHLGHRSGVG